MAHSADVSSNLARPLGVVAIFTEGCREFFRGHTQGTDLSHYGLKHGNVRHCTSMAIAARQVLLTRTNQLLWFTSCEKPDTCS